MQSSLTPQEINDRLGVSFQDETIIAFDGGDSISVLMRNGQIQTTTLEDPAAAYAEKYLVANETEEHKVHLHMKDDQVIQEDDEARPMLHPADKFGGIRARVSRRNATGRKSATPNR